MSADSGASAQGQREGGSHSRPAVWPSGQLVLPELYQAWEGGPALMKLCLLGRETAGGSPQPGPRMLVRSRSSPKKSNGLVHFPASSLGTRMTFWLFTLY